jgi:hypothetical protein
MMPDYLIGLDTICAKGELKQEFNRHSFITPYDWEIIGIAN